MAPSTSPLVIDLADVRNGYPSLAKWIARDPDDEPLVFRKFGVLAARNILSLQCQMVTLGDEIEGLESEIRQSADLETRRSLQRWEVLCERAIPGSNSLELQLQVKLKELQGLLKEYCWSLHHILGFMLIHWPDEALTLRAQVAQLDKPSQRILTTYKDYLNGTAIQNMPVSSKKLIFGRASKFLEDTQDLVALQKPSNQDYLSRSLRNHWLFTKHSPREELDRSNRYNDTLVAQVVAAISMVLAAVLLVGAIVSLYFLSNPNAKLGLIAVYTLLFALSDEQKSSLPLLRMLLY
ncbi:hypothetical protein J4E85_008922 [Alternaria conjuncta]|uniref:uncharacterized protein n=1 Tax=Alternaria conjuncta TaxID=181017 RepID=UPI00221E70C4|nr:uncharacterized protein J4E85_008922 [Alternaria conjuncta]KAI4920807.1 hypothetical protein J4E85_008922 [Alternaria conjuncta]